MQRNKGGETKGDHVHLNNLNRNNMSRIHFLGITGTSVRGLRIFLFILGTDT